jgi:hypothetical protein
MKALRYTIYSFVILLCSVVFATSAHAADRYWVGGTGNWDGSTTTHWSTASGGGGGASVPTSADNVYFNSASNATAYSVTVTATANCRNLSVANPASGALTFAGSSALSIYGTTSFSAGITNNYTGAITMRASTASKGVGSQESDPLGVAFSADGTKMYVIGDVDNFVYQYTLSTAWDVSTAAYSSSKDVSAQADLAVDVAFSSDGTKMYVTDDITTVVYQYTLSTAWNVTTASYTTSKSVSAQDGSPTGVAFNSDGTKMYVSGDSNNTVYQYTLATAWNVSTATYASLSKSVSAQDTSVNNLAFSADGTKMYIVGNVNNTLYQYTLATAWNVSTATYASLSKSVSAQDSSPSDVFIRQDTGTSMYVMGNNNTTVYQYTLGTAWNVSTANYGSIKTITTNGVTLGSTLTFNGSGDTWQLADNLSYSAATLTLTAGTFDPNGKTVSMTGAGTKVISGAFTFYNLTRTGTAVTTDALTINSTVTVTNLLTFTGDSIINKLIVRSNSTGVQRKLSAGSVSLSNVRFQDIDADGAAIPWAGTAIADGGNNLDITFSSAVSYWVGGSGNWSDAANHWAASSGGAPGAGNLPTMDTGVVFDTASNATAYTVTVDSSASSKNFSMSNPASGVVTLAGSAALAVYGSFSLASGMTNSYTGTITFGATTATTITPNGVSLSSPLDFNGPGGSWQLQGALSTTGAVTLTTGSLDTNNQSVSSRSFATGSGVDTLTLGSSAWTVTGNNTTVWDTATNVPPTFTTGTATVAATYAGSTGTRTIAFGATGVTYTMNLSVSAGTDTVIIANAYLKNLNFTGFSGTWSAASGQLNIFGDVTLGSGMTNNNAADMYFIDESYLGGGMLPTLDVSAQTQYVFDVTFSVDGTRMFIGGYATGTYYQYALSTPWDVSTASYAGSYAVGTYAFGIAFNSSGTSAYFADAGTVRQRTLSTPWDITTASGSASASLSVSTPFTISFNATGTRLYTTANDGIVYAYPLSSAWNITTIGAPSTHDVTAQDNQTMAVAFKSDGTKMYVSGMGGPGAYQYSLASAWDVTTASYDSVSVAIASISLSFNSDGTKMYLSTMSGGIYEFTLSTPWDLSTASPGASLSKTITSNGKALHSNVIFMGPVSSWQLQDAFSTSGDVLLDAGELDTNGKSVSSRTFVGGDSNGSGTYTTILMLGSSTWTVTGNNGTIWDATTYPLSVSTNSGTVAASYSGSVGIRTFSFGDYVDNPSLSVTAGSDQVVTNVASLGGLNFTGFSGTWSASSGALSIYGSLTLSSGMTNSYTGALTMASTGTGKTITTNGKTLASTVAFDGVGGGWQLSDNLTTTGVLTLTNGTLNDGGVNVSAPSFSSSNANTRSLTKGVGTWTLNGTGTVWDVDTSTNLTLTDSGTIKLTNNSSSAKTFAGGGKTYGNYWNATAGTGTVTMTGSNTFSGFTSDAGRTNLFTAGTTQTMGSCSINGTLGNVITLGSTASSQFYLVKSGGGTVTAPYVSASYSNVSPALTWYQGTSFNNGGNNTGWVGPPNTKAVQGTIKMNGSFKIQ